MPESPTDPNRTFVRIEAGRPVPPELKGCVLAIGNFDGLHRGHQVLLDEAKAVARSLAKPAVVLTFEPHPRAYFTGEPVFRLTPPSLRAELLERFGMDGVIERRFDEAMANRSAQAFIDDILIAQCGIDHIVAGYDFHFGHNRSGDPETLEQAGAREGFGVTIVEPVRFEADEAISSSRIRALLGSGEVETANQLLGYRYTVEGRVQKGQQLGRTLGYPTANMALPPEHELAHGIYAVRYRRADGTLHDGVASYGRRPTVTEAGESLLETFLFDMSADLYGETGAVSLFAFQRGEEKFDGLEPLIAQMRKDEAEARRLLAEAEPLSPLDEAIAFARQGRR